MTLSRLMPALQTGHTCLLGLVSNHCKQERKVHEGNKPTRVVRQSQQGGYRDQRPHTGNMSTSKEHLKEPTSLILHLALDKYLLVVQSKLPLNAIIIKQAF